MPVRSTKSDDSRASKSISSMFSSMPVTSCSAGVSPVMTGRPKTGMFDFLFRSGKPWFKPQNNVGNRGLIKQIRAMRGPWHEESAGERPVVGIGRRIGRASRRASIVVSPATNARCYPRFARDFRADGGFDDRGRSS